MAVRPILKWGEAVLHDAARPVAGFDSEIEALLRQPVFLELVVKVRPKWRRDERMLERLGL